MTTDNTQTDAGSPVSSKALLAFPGRHSYNCDSYCQSCLQSHTDLARWLIAASGANPRLTDILGDYRKWLDSESIHAEGSDGWGTAETFDHTSASRYVRDVWGHEPVCNANTQAEGRVSRTLSRIVGGTIGGKQ